MTEGLEIANRWRRFFALARAHQHALVEFKDSYLKACRSWHQLKDAVVALLPNVDGPVHTFLSSLQDNNQAPFDTVDDGAMYDRIKIMDQVLTLLREQRKR